MEPVQPSRRQSHEPDGRELSVRAHALRARIEELAECEEGTDTASELEGPHALDCKSTVTKPSGSVLDLARRVRQISAGNVPPTPSSVPQTNIDQLPHRRTVRPAGGLAIVRTNEQADQTASAWLKLTPVWLISAVFHAVIIVALALMTYSKIGFSPTVILARTAEVQVIPEALDTLDLTAPQLSLEEPLWSQELMDPGLEVMTVPDDLSPPELALAASPLAVLEEQLAASERVGRAITQTKKRTGAQFYGIQADGNRFVFIVDSSTSMHLKFADAKRELETAVRGLNDDQLFYVIFFDRDAERLRLGEWTSTGSRFALKRRPEPNLVPASDENLHALVYWMNTIQLDSDTNPYPAVVYALRKLQPDAVFLLSDGEFNDGGATEAFLAKENLVEDPVRGPKVKTVIHCVGFHSRQGEVTLKRIAETYGGTYRFVAPPRGLLRTLLPLFGAGGPVR